MMDVHATDSLAEPEGRAADGPLTGLRVLEVGTLLAGPFAARLLGDFGAEVIKLEAPGTGDPLREWGNGTAEGRSLWWAVQSRNKKLVTLNLRDAHGQELCRRLAAECDVLVENFRPGTMERWGLGPDVLHEIKPDLVYTRVSGFGQTGPYSSRPGFASAGEAMGGLRHLNGFPGQAPPRLGISLGDSLAGTFATLGTLMALHHRRAHDGAGQVVDASIMESCFAMLEGIVPEYGKLGVVRQPSGTALANVAPSNLYRSRDGKWVVIAANSPNLWVRLCRAIGREDLIEDERFATHVARGANMTELDEIIGGWVAEHDAGEVDALLNEAEVVCAPVYTVADIFRDPHYAARQMIVRMHDPVLGELAAPGITPKLSATPGAARFTGSTVLGAHNDEVYGELLGLGGAELDHLREQGVV
jgi:formyl-CoA transferase